MKTHIRSQIEVKSSLSFLFFFKDEFVDIFKI